MVSNTQPPIIDSHIHLFNSSHLPYLAWAVPESPLYAAHSVREYLSSIPAAQQAAFEGFVFVETDRRHTIPSQNAIASNDTAALRESWKWTLEEFDFVHLLSRESKLVRGIVPWAPMNLGVPAMERYWALLALDGEADNGRRKVLKGFRYLVQDKPRGTITEPEFVAAMEWVWRKGLVVEIGIDVRSGGVEQLEEAVRAIRQIVLKNDIPIETGAFVISMLSTLYSHSHMLIGGNIDHLCKPDLRHTHVESLRARWSELLTSLATSHASITMKLSGVFSELPHDSELYPPDSAESFMLEQVGPWAEEALRIFGPRRILWGSDWPVCKLGYEKMFPELDSAGAWECWRKLTVRLFHRMGIEEGGHDERAIWAGNAVRVYKLDVEGSR